MAALLRIIPGLLALLSLIGKFVASRKARADARKEIEGEIAVQELKVANEVTEVMAERRPDGAAADRMRDGKF